MLYVVHRIKKLRTMAMTLSGSIRRHRRIAGTLYLIEKDIQNV